MTCGRLLLVLSRRLRLQMFGTSGFILEVLELDSLVRSNFYSRLFYIRRGEEIFFVNKPQGGGIKKGGHFWSPFIFTLVSIRQIYIDLLLLVDLISYNRSMLFLYLFQTVHRVLILVVVVIPQLLLCCSCCFIIEHIIESCCSFISIVELLSIYKECAI